MIGNYRKFRETDAEAVTAMMYSLDREDPGKSSITADCIMTTFQALHPASNRGSIMVMDMSGEIVGYAILVNYWSNVTGGNICCIDELYVAPSHRSRGIGGGFISHLKSLRSGDSRALMIPLHRNNQRAYQLYRKMGFTVMDELWVALSLE